VPPDAHGEALTAGGKVKVTATGVRISGIELDPGVMSRMRVEDLARHLMDAVNGALDAAAASADGGGTDDNGAEVADLAEQVTQIQLQGARQMAAINDAVQMMLQQVKEKA
jgi:DNA-binding protein YbaB